MVKFSAANVKIQALSAVSGISRFLDKKRKVYSFDLLSGFSCPFAKDCLSKAVEQPDGKRKIVDGPHTEFRCFSASQEVLFTNLYKLRKGNFDALRGKSTDDMTGILQTALPKNAGVIRIHVGGDFFCEAYFLAWCKLAENNPDVLFYAYTKSLTYWIKNKNSVPNNLVLTASRGGRCDDLIEPNKLRAVVVVYSETEAADKGLEIDHDDSHAANPLYRFKPFALLIHGTQPKGSKASDAIKVLKKDGVQFAYSRK